VKTSRITFGTG